jgi:hypothetical protein
MEIEPSADIDAIESRIELLRDRMESCRKGLLISRIVLVVGGVWLALALLGVSRSVEGLFLSMAACLAGVIGIGTNMSTHRQADAELKRELAERNVLIDHLDPRILQ